MIVDKFVSYPKWRAIDVVSSKYIGDKVSSKIFYHNMLSINSMKIYGQ